MEYNLTDHLGSTRMMYKLNFTCAGVYQNATIQYLADYYSFGKIVREYINPGTLAEKYQYTGKERDTESGYDYFNARNYHSEVGRFLSVDPLAGKYPGISPYAYVANNPINAIDPDGRDIVDAQGRHVNISFNKNGTLSFSKNATSDIRRVANALNLTAAGRTQLKAVNQSDIHVKINISTDSKIEKKDDGTYYTYGETVQGNYNSKDNYGKNVNADGTYGIKEATITIYEGTITEDAKRSDAKHGGLTTEQAIGAVAGHEIVHATDHVEINKDISVEQNGSQKEKNARKISREIKPNQVESKIIEQSKTSNE